MISGKEFDLYKPRHNLPHPFYESFIGRDAEIKLLRDLLAPDNSSWLVMIDGIAGIGKTALAIEIGLYYVMRYQSIPPEERFAAIIWISSSASFLVPEGEQRLLYSVKSLGDIFDVIASVARFDTTLMENVSYENRNNYVRRLLSAHRILLIIDGLESILNDEITQFIYELPVPTKTIITTRHQIDIAYPVRLVGMTRDNAQALVAQECKKHSLILTDLEMNRLCEATGGVPLAIVWSIGQVAQGYDFNTVLQRLGKNNDAVALFCFESALSEIRGKESHKLLMALSLFATDADREALGIVAGLKNDFLARDAGLSLLQKLSLINRHAGRFDMLPLTQVYVREESVNYKGFVVEARERLFQYMLDLISTQIGTNYWDSITHWLSIDKLELEIENLLQTVTWAIEAQRYDVVLYVGGALVHYLWRVGRSEERRRMSEQGIFAAQQLGEYQWAAWLLIDGLGYIYLARQDFEKAESVIVEGRQIAEQGGFEEGIVLAQAYLANIAIMRGHHDQAQEYLKATEGRTQLAAILARVKAVEGLLALTDVDLVAAERYYKESIYYRQQSDGYLPPTQSALLGLIQARQGRFQEAQVTLEEALRHKRQTLEGTGYAKFGLAVLKKAEGDLGSALALAGEALECMRALRIEHQVIEIQEFLDATSTKSNSTKD